MARIPTVERSRRGWLLRIANFATRRLRGAELEPTNVLGHNSWVLVAAAGLERGMAQASHLPPKLKSLVGIKGAMLIGCRF